MSRQRIRLVACDRNPAPPEAPAPIASFIGQLIAHVAWHEGAINRCPCCGHTAWHVGRITAECAGCGHPLGIVRQHRIPNRGD